MLNALTIDVEDYFQVSAFDEIVRFEDWSRYESRVERNTDSLLSLLTDKEIKATVFVLGWIADRYPKLVRDIQKEGHEIACHGYAHRLIYEHSRGFFRDDTRRAKAILEDITGEKVIGYRAPSYSIIKESLWALDILVEEGFEYDSSIFPIRHDRYGIPNGKRFPHSISRNRDKCIIEFPLSTIRFCGTNFPLAGGGYFRLFPYWLIRWGLNRINKAEKQGFIFYLHPWEIDPYQPRFNPGYISRFRHYVNLDRTREKLKRLISDFRFTTVKMVLANQDLIVL
ncbi:MAG: XrtA system polysaccharide deacetylase [Thermodesulfobacteriota bacterium]|nr:XrtA system polysaccharide deacetylase [Thermodesulfobacteriota bacterium]